MNESYDVVVIGAGPAGYVCAIRAAQNGLKTACVDNWKNPDGKHALGGTCLNAGCIPSKALLESSEMFHKAKHEFASHGIKLGTPQVDVQVMQARKSRIVSSLTGGIAALFKSNNVTGIQGTARLLKNGSVEVSDSGDPKKKDIIQARHIVLASGSEPVELKVAPFDGKDIVDSWGALEFTSVPKRLGIIGGGVIGLELGSVWHRLGSEVAIIEAMENFLFMADQQIAQAAAREFKKQGLNVRLGSKVTAAIKGKDGVRVQYEDKDGRHDLTVDKLIVCVGRKPATANLLEDGCGVKTDSRGFIQVDDECRTGVRNIWAIGDCVRGPMLAHKGSEEGVMVADLMAGKVAEMNYDVIPSIIYTWPEIAWVGKTEEELKKQAIRYKAGSFPFAANGRAKAMEAPAGMVKILARADTDEILGVHILGPMASELIAEAVVAMEFRASAEDIQRTIHAHPTLSEAMHEASLAADKRAIHAINR
ncbi:MAG: dihydrolipoyl dehydrogenase [Gammaproteobacteria bacterium]|nr:dihydrolipoyl dehydrogenase [Gammaproteobacteria bacterium]MDE2346824.1 dihydrolipoyl dehydrogenase [Gammaproteobacteria bacterium]